MAPRPGTATMRTMTSSPTAAMTTMMGVPVRGLTAPATMMTGSELVALIAVLPAVGAQQRPWRQAEAVAAAVKLLQEGRRNG